MNWTRNKFGHEGIQLRLRTMNLRLRSSPIYRVVGGGIVSLMDPSLTLVSTMMGDQEREAKLCMQVSKSEEEKARHACNLLYLACMQGEESEVRKWKPPLLEREGGWGVQETHARLYSMDVP